LKNYLELKRYSTPEIPGPPIRVKIHILLGNAGLPPFRRIFSADSGAFRASSFMKAIDVVPTLASEWSSGTSSLAL
jgi:hypothetical protein